MIVGGCLCGGVRYEIHAHVAEIQLCYCRTCRKAQGGPLASVIPVPARAFVITQGEDLLRDFESSPGKHRIFCGVCGGPIISRRDGSPESVRVRAGSVDDDPGARPVSHAFVADKAPWWSIDDDLPAYDGARPAGR